MAAIKPLAQIAEKYARVTAGRTQDYEIGIQNPRADWAQATMAAAQSYNQAVTQAAAQNRFSKGVQKSGTANWQQKSLTKGPSRFAAGVALAQPDYEAGFAPYAQVIASTNLPPRKPKGDPSNIQRVAVLAAALNKRRMSGS